MIPPLYHMSNAAEDLEQMQKSNKSSAFNPPPTDEISMIDQEIPIQLPSKKFTLDASMFYESMDARKDENMIEGIEIYQS